jgi:hypothetical protein
MITWISNQDLFFNLLGVYDEDIETPLAFDDMLITYYKKSPLYKGLYKNEITVNHVSDQFKSLITNDIQQLTFNITINNSNKLLNITSLLKIMLYKHYQYDINDIMIQYTNDTVVLIPTANVNDSIDNIYCTQDNYNKITTLIDLSQLVNYTPLLDLTNDPISLEIKSSDLIWTYDLSPFNYINLYDIPVVNINSNDAIDTKACYVELTIDKISPIVSYIINLLPTTFFVTDINKNVIDRLTTDFNFKVIPSLLTPNRFCLQHNCLDEQWFYQNLNRLDNNKTPLYSFNIGLYDYRHTQDLLQAMLALKEITIKAYTQITNNNLLANDIYVDSSMNVTVPILNDSMINQLYHTLSCDF